MSLPAFLFLGWMISLLNNFYKELTGCRISSKFLYRQKAKIKELKRCSMPSNKLQSSHNLIFSSKSHDPLFILILLKNYHLIKLFYKFIYYKNKHQNIIKKRKSTYFLLKVEIFNFAKNDK